jgi:hypothetical protein
MKTNQMKFHLRIGFKGISVPSGTMGSGVNRFFVSSSGLSITGKTQQENE